MKTHLKIHYKKSKKIREPVSITNNYNTITKNTIVCPNLETEEAMQLKEYVEKMSTVENRTENFKVDINPLETNNMNYLQYMNCQAQATNFVNNLNNFNYLNNLINLNSFLPMLMTQNTQPELLNNPIMGVYNMLMANQLINNSNN